MFEEQGPNRDSWVQLDQVCCQMCLVHSKCDGYEHTPRHLGWVHEHGLVHFDVIVIKHLCRSGPEFQAGFFQGEGCLPHIHPGKKCRNLCAVKLGQSSKRFLSHVVDDEIGE